MTKQQAINIINSLTADDLARALAADMSGDLSPLPDRSIAFHKEAQVQALAVRIRVAAALLGAPTPVILTAALETALVCGILFGLLYSTERRDIEELEKMMGEQ